MQTRTQVALIVVVIEVIVAGAVSYIVLVPTSTGPSPSGPSGPAECPSSPEGLMAENWTTYH